MCDSVSCAHHEIEPLLFYIKRVNHIIRNISLVRAIYSLYHRIPYDVVMAHLYTYVANLTIQDHEAVEL